MSAFIQHDDAFDATVVKALGDDFPKTFDVLFEGLIEISGLGDGAFDNRDAKIANSCDDGGVVRIDLT